MLVQVTISHRAPDAIRATGLGGYQTFLSTGLGVGPLIAGATAQQGGFGWGFAVVAAFGVGAAAVAAALLRVAGAASD
jgi:MFS family permease